MAKKRKKSFFSEKLPKKEYWEIEDEEEQGDLVSACSEAPEITVAISPHCVSQIVALMEDPVIGDEEWAADLIGEVDESTFYVNSLKIFKQEVSYASVKRLEPPAEGTIGVIHSHHTMGAFFSSIDEDGANSNHRLSGVIAKSNGGVFPYDIQFAAIKVKVPCGKYIKVEPTVILMYGSEDSSFIEEARKLIQPEAKTIYPIYGYEYEKNKKKREELPF